MTPRKECVTYDLTLWWCNPSIVSKITPDTSLDRSTVACRSGVDGTLQWTIHHPAIIVCSRWIANRTTDLTFNRLSISLLPLVICVKSNHVSTMFHHQFWVISSKILNDTGICNYFHILQILLNLYYCIRHNKDPNPILSSINPSLVEGCDGRSINAGLS